MRINASRTTATLIALIALIALLGVSGAGSVTAQTGETMCETVTFEGEGTESSPYVVTTVEQLQCVGDQADAYYVLGNDINAESTATLNNGEGFMPIGGVSYEGESDIEEVEEFERQIEEFEEECYGAAETEAEIAACDEQIDELEDSLYGVAEDEDEDSDEVLYTGDGFTGYFDGAGYEISGLTVNSQDSVNGFMSRIAPSGVVDDVTFTDLTVTGTDSVGGVAGVNEGMISNVRVSGDVTGTLEVGGVAGVNTGTIAAAVLTGSVSGGESVAGVSALNRGTVANSRSEMAVSADLEFAAGVSTTNEGQISNVEVKSDVSAGDFGVGGLVYENEGQLTDSRFEGTVSADDDVGVLAAENTGDVVDSVWSSLTTTVVVDGQDVTEERFAFVTFDTSGVDDVTNATAQDEPLPEEVTITEENLDISDSDTGLPIALIVGGLVLALILVAVVARFIL